MLIEAENVSRLYGSGSSQVAALQEVSLTIIYDFAQIFKHQTVSSIYFHQKNAIYKFLLLSPEDCDTLNLSDLLKRFRK